MKTCLTFLTAAALLLPAMFVAPSAYAADRAPIYDETKDLKAEISNALTTARTENKRLLFQWGGNWCGWCYKLHDLFNEDEAIRSLLDEKYILVMIDSSTQQPLAAALKTNIAGVPFLTILDADGNKLVDQETGSLEIGNRHDPAKVLAFLNEWKTSDLSAYETLDQAKAKAAKEDKLVFVHFSTPSCGWCKRLEAFMKRPAVAPLFKEHFVVAKIDQVEMPEGTELRKKLGGSDGGVPWYAMLSGQGEVLATATGPRGNIGYPVHDHEIAHFIDMLEQAAPNITAEERETVKSELEKVGVELGRR